MSPVTSRTSAGCSYRGGAPGGAGGDCLELAEVAAGLSKLPRLLVKVVQGIVTPARAARRGSTDRRAEEETPEPCSLFSSGTIFTILGYLATSRWTIAANFLLVVALFMRFGTLWMFSLAWRL